MCVCIYVCVYIYIYRSWFIVTLGFELYIYIVSFVRIIYFFMDKCIDYFYNKLSMTWLINNENNCFIVCSFRPCVSLLAVVWLFYLQSSISDVVLKWYKFVFIYYTAIFDKLLSVQEKICLRQLMYYFT